MPHQRTTVGRGRRTSFADAPEVGEAFAVGLAQVNLAMPDTDGRTAQGGVTFEVDLTELARRRAAAAP